MGNQFFKFLFMCMGVLPACMSLHQVFPWCFQRSEEGVQFPVIIVTDNCGLPHGSWYLILGPLEEQPVLLTSEPSLQPSVRFFVG